MGISRSENMRRIRSRDTAPELRVRKLLRGLGYSGYRLHRADLPGKPDVAFVGRKKAIFIHGCFWHGHDCPEGVRKPKSNEGYWLPKLARNRERDARNVESLQERGWSVLVLWDCALGNDSRLSHQIRAFMDDAGQEQLS